MVVVHDCTEHRSLCIFYVTKKVSARCASMFGAQKIFGTQAKGRMGKGWRKWKSVTGVMRDRRMPYKPKGKAYKKVIRSTILYGSECWAIKKDDEGRLGKMEMKMLRRSVGVTIRDKIRN